jgi:hypothetical protein
LVNMLVFMHFYARGQSIEMKNLSWIGTAI